jgi:segregation and condensation protein B
MPTELDPDRLKLVIESVLFVADGPVELRTLARLTEQTPEVISQAIEELGATSRERGVRIQRTGQSAQMVSAPETAPYVQRYLGIDENQRLSPVVLVTLTVIAYKQPVTKGDVERILRKNCDYSVMVLKARDLINEVGRTDGPGRPYLYGTTFKFLEHFGLEKPEDLPPLPELEVAAALVAENGGGAIEESPAEVLDKDPAFAEAAEAPGA